MTTACMGPSLCMVGNLLVAPGQQRSTCLEPALHWIVSVPEMWLLTAVISALSFHFWLEDRLSLLQSIMDLVSVPGLAPDELPCTWMTKFLNSLLKKVSIESFKTAIKLSVVGRLTPHDMSPQFSLQPVAEIPPLTSHDHTDLTLLWQLSRSGLIQHGKAKCHHRTSPLILMELGSPLGDAGLPPGLREGAGSKRHLQSGGQPWTAAPMSVPVGDGPSYAVHRKGKRLHSTGESPSPSLWLFPVADGMVEMELAFGCLRGSRDAGKPAWLNSFTSLPAPVFMEGLSRLGSVLIFQQNEILIFS